MNITVKNTKKECCAMIDYTATEKANFDERAFAVSTAITNIVAEFVHKEDCDSIEQAKAIVKLIEEMSSDMTKEYIDVYYNQIEAIKEQNQLYEIAVETFNKWLENSEFQGDMASFEEQYKNSKELEINFGFVPHQKAFFYLTTDKFIGHKLTEFSLSIVDDEKALERISIEAFMIALVIGDIIFGEDETKNPVRILSQKNPVDGGLSQLVKNTLKGECTNE